MSYPRKPVYFNEARNKPLPYNAGANKNDKTDDHKLKQLSRCCICFENYSLNTRAPLCVPCGHTFCTVCIRKLIYGNLVCCCICRKVTFFGPTELGKNIQLLDILESLELLDPDERKVGQMQFAPVFPENVVESLEDNDLVKFFEFCFNFIKKFYENKQDNMVTSLAMHGNRQVADNANQMFFARTRLGESLDRALVLFNDCIRTMNSPEVDDTPHVIAAYGGIDDFVPVIDDDYNDPFGLESASIHAFISLGSNHDLAFINAFEGVDTSDQSPDLTFADAFNSNSGSDYDTSGNDYNGSVHEYFNPGHDFNRVNNEYNTGNTNYNRGNDDYNRGNDDYNRGNDVNNHGNDDYNRGNADNNHGNGDFRSGPADDEEFEDPFQPGPWNPISKLFDIPRFQNNHY